MRGAARRRSTSEGKGDRLSSTLNLPEALRFDRFNSIDMHPLFKLILQGLLMIILKVVEGRGLNPESVLDQGVFLILST